MENTFIGIDISKSFFDVAIPASGKYRHQKLSNDLAGFEKLLEALKDCPQAVCVMEASGPYYLPLATYLHGKGMGVSVVNPLSVRHFSRMLMLRTKTDKKDAAMLSAYGQNQKPMLWQPEPSQVLALKQLQTVSEGLQKTLHLHERQLEAQQASGIVTRQARKSLEGMIRQARKEMAKVEQAMEQLVKEHYHQQYEQLKSVPGLGLKSSMLLLIISGGFSRFAHVKQLISYVGLCPRIYESGTSIKGKASICKMGMSQVRKTLYVCSWSAIRCNKACKELYERLLAKGKAKKLALVAVANKLLKQAFAVATKNEYYSDSSKTKKLYELA